MPTEGSLTLLTWLALVLAIATGEWLGLGLAQLSRTLSGRLADWVRRRRLRRNLPGLERQAYAQREVDRQNFEQDLRRIPALSPEAISEQLRMFDSITDGAIRHSVSHMRRSVGLPEPE